MSFYYANPKRGADTDEIAVGYQVGDGSVVYLPTLSAATETLSEATFSLPSVALKEDVRIVFTATCNIGYGVGIDDVKVTAVPLPTYEVTYKVVNGTWSNGETADIAETVRSGAKPASVPTGMKASPGYTGGAWDPDPADATITEATTFTYTFTAKQAAAVTKAPTAKTLRYNRSAQELVTAGQASGGEMQYALGTATAATEPYTTSIPAKTDAGTYYVWYKATGDDNHRDSEPKCVAVTIEPEQKQEKAAPTTTKRSRSSSRTSSPEVERLWGDDRYATMSAILNEGFDSSAWAVLASGANYPDALAASGLAGAYGAPWC